MYSSPRISAWIDAVPSDDKYTAPSLDPEPHRQAQGDDEPEHHRRKRVCRRSSWSASDSSIFTPTPSVLHHSVTSMAAAKTNASSFTFPRPQRAPPSDTSSVLDGPKLPTTSRSRRGRSASPKRLQSTMATLANDSQPRVLIIPEFQASTKVLRRAKDLTELMKKDLGTGVIPACLKSELERVDPAFSQIPEAAFDSGSAELTPDIMRFWEEVREIYRDAWLCEEHQKDENAWVQVAWALFKLAIKESRADLLEVNNIQTQTIDPAFLPQLSDQSTISRKADLALAFRPDHPDTRVLYDKWKATFPDYDLSPLADTYTRNLLVSYALEAKRSDGSEKEAQLQLALFHSAVLIKLYSILSENRLDMGYGDVPPMLGWTMVGHRWQFHITSFLEDGNILCQSPIFLTLLGPDLTISSYYPLFYLIHLLKRACSHLKDSLWPDLNARILAGLAPS